MLSQPENQQQLNLLNHNIDAAEHLLMLIAIKFNYIDGTVQLSAKTLDAEHLLIKVKDSGVGIASSDQTLIFDPLSRLTYAEENGISGIGIGLSIVNDLIIQTNGTIVVTGNIDKGSEFTITLPLENITAS